MTGAPEPRGADAAMLLRPGLSEADIAEALRDGPTERFCRLLAMMLDPPPGKRPLYRLRLSRADDHRPKAPPRSELGAAMVDAVDAAKWGEGKRAKQEVADRFQVSVRTAERAMSREREHRLRIAALKNAKK